MSKVYDKISISVLIFLETVVFCYTPKIAQRLSKYRNKWINVYNLNNATSGALLALAITHLLPEGFQKNSKSFIIFQSIDTRGFIVIAPILLLVTIDFLAGIELNSYVMNRTPLRKPSKGRTSVNTFKRVSVVNYIVLRRFSICDVHGDPFECDDKPYSNGSTSDSDVTSNHRRLGLDFIVIHIKRILCSRSLYLLMAFYGHSVLEGTLIGSENGCSLWAMAFGIIAHKWAECLLLSTILSNLLSSEWCKNICIILFAFCVPIGVLIGYFTVSTSDGICYVIFTLLAVGFFIYLSFELFTGNIGQETSSRVILWTFFILGSVLMSTILGISNILEKDEPIQLCSEIP